MKLRIIPKYNVKRNSFPYVSLAKVKQGYSWFGWKGWIV